MKEVDQALRAVEALTAVGIALTSLEYLARPHQLEDGGIHSWEVERTRSRRTATKKADCLNYLMRPPGIQLIFALRAAAAGVLTLPRSGERSRNIAVAYLTATTYLLLYRIRYGADGTDHMTMVTYSALSAARLAPRDRVVKEAAIWFVAGQTMLSYSAAGLAKVRGAPWRTGMAMPGIFRTHTYGDKRVYDLVRDPPWRGRAASWVVMIGESVIPLALIAPKRTAWALLSAGALFHAGNAVFMGLNRFVWAFVGNYPAVVYCAKNVGMHDLVQLGYAVWSLLPQSRSHAAPAPQNKDG